MKKKKVRIRDIILPMIPLLGACALLFWAWVWSYLGMRDFFFINIAAALIIGMDYPATQICRKLDARFDRLEELLTEHDQERKKDSATEKDLDIQ